METLICPACGKELDVVRMEDADDEEFEEYDGEEEPEETESPNEDRPQDGGSASEPPRAD